MKVFVGLVDQSRGIIQVKFFLFNQTLDFQGIPYFRLYPLTPGGQQKYPAS